VIETAILLAAGEGSRLRPAAPLKPLCKVGEQSLLSHAIKRLAAAGLKRVVVVLGYGADEVQAHIGGHLWPVAVETVRNNDYHSPNGTSVLAAEPLVRGEEALLAMCDHLVEPALYRLLAKEGPCLGARLGVDWRMNSDWVDLQDVTRVKSASGHIVAIGKGIADYNCFDTGVFAIGTALFEALRRLESPSLTEGVRALAEQGSAHTVDCGELGWIDVDDLSALEKAESWVAAKMSAPSVPETR
jgi:1L-myo-inositol 1-phosphate cytidylyltransferase